MKKRYNSGILNICLIVFCFCGLWALSACTTGRYVSPQHKNGMALLAQQQPEKAAAQFSEGIGVATQAGNRAAAAELTAILGWTQAEMLNFHEAEALLTRAIRMVQEQGGDPAVMYGRLAVVRAKSSQVEKGLAAAAKALELTAARWRSKSKLNATDEIIGYAVHNAGMPPDEDMIRAAIMAQAARAILYFNANDLEQAARWGERTVDHCNALTFIMKMAPAEDRLTFYQGKGVAAGVASRAYALLEDPKRSAELLQAGKDAFDQIGITVKDDDLLAAYIASGRYDRHARKQDHGDLRFSEGYNQAMTLWETGRLEEARTAFETVIDRAAKEARTMELARALSQQGWLAAETGRYAQAVKLLEHSIATTPQADEAAMSHTRLAAILARLGNIEKALAEAEQALAVALRNRPAQFGGLNRTTAIERFVANPGLPPDVVMLKAVLGSTAARTISWYFLGDYPRAAAAGKKSVHYFQKAEKAISLAAARERRDFYDGAGYAAMATGDALTFMGAPDKGRAYLELAETYFEISGSVFGRYATRSLYACSFLREKRYPEGAAIIRAMWDRLGAVGFEDILWRAKGRFAYYFDQHARELIDDLGTAASDTPAAGKLSAEASRRKTSVVADIKRQLDSVSLLLADDDAAQTGRLVAALEQAETGPALSKAAGDLVRRIKLIAYRNYAAALDRIESLRAALETDLNKRSFRADKQLLYDGYIRLSVELFGARAGLEALERSKARNLLDLMATREVDFENPLAHSVRKLRREITQTPVPDQNSTLAAGAESLSASDVARYRAIVVQLKKEAPELASFISADHLPYREIAALIPARTALCAYHLARDYGFIFTVFKGQARVVQIKVDRPALTAKIRSLREAIFKKGDARVDTLARELYGQLVRPVATHLDADRIIIVPDKALFYLPFAALHDGQAYLIERFSLAYTPSMGILKYARAKARPKTGRVLALGNPDLGNPKMDLPSAQAEAQKVAARFPGSRVYLGAQATETVARSAAARYDIIHFATHGEFSTADPLYSSLRLAADSKNDGRLEAAEIFSLRISPWLVTLSACRTGLGVVTSGGEVIGLNRAFIYAGAPAVVSSLWSIGDESTAFLMEKFYENLKVMPRDATLRAAQVDMLYGGQYRQPFYWAAFYLTGDFR